MIETVNAFASGFSQIFTATTFGLMLLGIVIGFFVGLLPGLGGPTTIALMLPFVVKMEAVEAFAFLLGMAAVCGTTGDITSILFGVPGEPTTAATILDGHPMAKKGEAGRAMGAALVSSLMGAIFGAFALALAIPIVRPLVLTFGSPEFFMLAVLGLSFIAALSGEALLKGLIAAGIGLFLATIGLDPISGIPRYTFGQLFLWDGIGLVPITIGFFAIPEIIELAVQGSSIAEKQAGGKVAGVMRGVRDSFRNWGLVLRCSAIGTYTAIIPGIGGATTQWLAYAHAMQSARNKEGFGKGRVEGVLGPGAANNSTIGGSLITTVAFGIPTSVLMAILLGAFIIQGLVPGPEMLLPEPKGHLALTFSFVWTIVVSNIITVAVCLLFLNQLAKITYVRGSILIPLILMLIYLGAFAEKNAFQDLVLVLIFGVLGWVMARLSWPRPPLILGLVLGPLAENRLFLSMELYGLAWVLRPGVLLLIALTLAGLFYPVLSARRRRAGAKERGRTSTKGAINSPGKNALRFSWSAVFGLVIIGTFILALVQSTTFSFRAGLFPWTIGSLILALALVQFIKDLFVGVKAQNSEGQWMEAATELPGPVVRRRTAEVFGWIIGCFLAIWFFGFSIGVPLFTFVKLKIHAREKLPLALALTAFSWALVYGLFDFVLKVPFPTGQLFRWL